jgi:signal transduction histidine kinase
LFYLASWLPLAMLFMVVMRNTTAGDWLTAAVYSLTYLVPAIALGAFFWVKVEEKIRWERMRWLQLLFRELANAAAYTVAMHILFALILWATGGRETVHAAIGQRLGWELFFGVQLYCVQAAVYHSIRVFAELRRKEIAAAEAENLRVRAEMEALRGQLNPHFLFNSLHSITALVREDAARAEEALLQFAGLLRRVLDLKREPADEVSLAEEMAFVDDYLAIERLRLGERLRVRRAISSEALTCRLPTFSVQPLVENAIRYAVTPRRDGGTVTLEGAVRDERLVLTVADDGPGAEAASVAQAKGVGLDVIRRRLRARHGDRATVLVDTAPGKGFRVTLALPAALKEDAA